MSRGQPSTCARQGARHVPLRVPAAAISAHQTQHPATHLHSPRVPTSVLSGLEKCHFMLSRLGCLVSSRQTRSPGANDGNALRPAATRVCRLGHGWLGVQHRCATTRCIRGKSGLAGCA